MKIVGSLALRIYGVAALTAAFALLLGALLLQGSARSREAFGWVSHTQEVLLGLDALQSNLGEAESGLRGFLLTRDDTYLARFNLNLAQGKELSSRLTMLVGDNPPQEKRATQLAALASAKSEVMRHAVARAHQGGAGMVPDARAREHGRMLMGAVGRLISTMRDAERQLLALRTAAADSQVERARALLLYGCPVFALLIAGIAWLIRSSVSRPLADLLDVVTRFGAGDRKARAATTVQSAEFKRLAFAYNGMADHLVAVMDQQSHAEAQLGRANAELVERGMALEARQRSVQILSEMSHRLQAIQSEGELSAVLDCFLPQIFPDLAGALYVHNHSRNMLLRLSKWGDPQGSPERWLGKSGQAAKWSFCLKAASMAAEQEIR